MIPGFLALYNHHLTEAVVVELPTQNYGGRYIVEYYNNDQKKIRTTYIPQGRKHIYLPKKVGERFSIYYKFGAPDSLSATYKYWHPSGFMLDETIWMSWMVWGIFIFNLIIFLKRRLKFKIEIKFFENTILKLNKIMKPKPSKVWFLDIRGVTDRSNEQADSAFSKLANILKGAGKPANFVPLLVDVLNNIPDGAVVLEKGDKFMQCICIEINPDLRLFRTEYCMGDVSIDNPLYSTRYNETAEITATLFESFYLENNDYLHEARWEISDWFKEQYLQ